MHPAMRVLATQSNSGGLAHMACSLLTKSSSQLLIILMTFYSTASVTEYSNYGGSVISPNPICQLLRRFPVLLGSFSERFCLCLHLELFSLYFHLAVPMFRVLYEDLLSILNSFFVQSKRYMSNFILLYMGIQSSHHC